MTDVLAEAPPDIVVLPVRGGSSSVTGRAARGVRWNAADQVVQQLVRLAVTFLLTKLATPADFGLIGMAFVLVQLASLLADLGLGPALVHRRELRQDHIGTAFVGSGAFGFLLGGLVAVSAPLVAHFFNEPRLTAVLVVMAINFPLKGLASTPRDLLRRDLLFRPFVIASAVSVTAAGAIAVVMASAGAGVWALVAYSVGESAIALVMSLFLAQRAGVFRPTLRCSRVALRELAGFGASVSGARLAYYAQLNLDNLLVAKVLGAAALGYYGLAYRIMLYPIQKVADVVGDVAFPAFAAVQGDLTRLGSGFVRSVRAVALVCFPASIGCLVAAPVLVPVVFGRPWAPAILTVQILAINGPRITVNRLNAALFQAVGRPEWDLWLGVGALPLFALAFVLGVDHGIEGVAWGYTIVGYAVLPLQQAMAARAAGTTSTHLLSKVAPVAVATALMAVVAEVVRHLTNGLSGPITLTAMVLAGALAYGVAILTIAGAATSDMVTLVRRRRPARRGPRPLLPAVPSTPVVSVVINNYNYERFVARAVESALAQTYGAVQVVVVDDGSTDGSLTVLRPYRDRVVLVEQANGGQAAAVNAGFAVAIGDIVLFLDADDELVPHAVERIVEAWRPGTAKVHYRLACIDADGEALGFSVPTADKELAEGDQVPTLLRSGRYTSPVMSGNAFSRHALNKVLPVPEDRYRISADGYLVTTVPFHGWVVAIDEPLGRYRMHGTNWWSPTEVDGQRLRAYLAHDVQKYESLAEVAEHTGRTLKPGIARRDHAHLRSRLASLRLNGRDHPFPKDRRLRLAWWGITTTLRYSELNRRRRLAFAGWFVVVAAAPSSMVRPVIDWVWVPHERPVSIRLAAGALRGGGRPAFLKREAWPMLGFTAAEGSSRLLSFLFYLLAARVLSPSGFGVLLYTVTLAALALVFTLVLVDAALRELGAARGDERRTSEVLGSLLLVAAVSLLLSSALTWGASKVGLTGSADLVGLQAVLIGRCFFELYYAVGRGMGAVSRMAFTYAGGSLFQLVVFGAIAVLGHPDPRVALLVFGVSFVVPIAVCEVHRPVLRGRGLSVSRSALGLMLRIAAPLLVGQVFYQVWNSADQIWVERVLGTQQIGLYSAVRNLSQLFLVLPYGVYGALLPRVAELRATGAGNRARRLARWTTGAVFVLTGIVAVALILVRGPLLDVLYGHEYRSAAPSLVAISLAMVVYSLFLGRTRAAIGWGRPGVYTIGIAVAAVTEVVLLGVGPHHQAWAGWSLLLSMLAGTFAVSAWLGRHPLADADPGAPIDEGLVVSWPDATGTTRERPGATGGNNPSHLAHPSVELSES